MEATKFLTMKVGPFGGDGGEMQDMNINGVTRILKVNIYYSKHIEAITITFLRDGLLESTEQWGIPEWGGSSAEFILHDSEYITSVKGHVDISYIRSLKFETNLQSFGPYGREDQGTYFELPAITGQIIGFHGRSGKYLSALGVYVQDTDKGRVLEDCKQKLEHTEAKYLMQLDMQNMLESKIVYLEMENKLQKTDFMQKEAAYIKQLQALSSSKDDLQQKLESKCREMDHFDWKALLPEMIADMIQNAKEMADNHLKIAQEKLVEAQSELEMLRASDGLLLISTITKEATAAIEDKVRTQIKASFGDFQIMKENLKLMKSQEINKNDLEDIKAAIKMVRSIEDHLKWLKSENINEDDEKKIQDSILSANDAVQSIENIINNGV